MAATELERLGWHLTGDYKARLSSDEPGNIDNIIKATLDTDLKEIGAAWLDENINNHTVDHVEGPGVLQLEDLCIVSSPKDDDVESQVAARICRLSLSDGHISCSAVTLEPIRGLNLRTPPGCKVLVSGKIEVNTKFLLLTTNNISLLGGRVSNLVEPWELKKNLLKQPEPTANDGEDKRPPPFVPFGQKISEEMLLLTKKGNFQSLTKTKEKKITAEEIEFRKNRQTALSEALRDKLVKDSQRAFRSGALNINYGDVRWIINQGFSPEEAVVALRSSFGNVRSAIDKLFNDRQRNQKDGNLRPPDTQQGGQPVSQRLPLNASYLPNRHYPGAHQQDSHIQHVRIYQGDTSVKQQMIPSQAVNRGPGPQGSQKPVGVQERSAVEQNTVDSVKYSALSKQTQASPEEKAGQLAPNLSESNQNDTCKNDQKQQLLNNVSDKQNKTQPEGSSNQHGSAQSSQEIGIQNTGVKTNFQEVSKTQDSEKENYQEQAVNSQPTNSSNNVSPDCQISLANHCPGDYKSSSTNVGASHQQHNYQILQNTDSSHRGRDEANISQHRPFRHYNTSYHNEQMSYSVPHGTQYFNPSFHSQPHIPPFGVQGMGPTVLVEAPFHGPPPVRGRFNNSGYTDYRGGYAGKGQYGTDVNGFTHGQYNNYYPPGSYNSNGGHNSRGAYNSNGGYNSSYNRGGYNSDGGYNSSYSRGGYNSDGGYNSSYSRGAYNNTFHRGSGTRRPYNQH